MKFVYRIYQLFIAVPIFFFATLLAGFSCTIGCLIGNGHIWGYYPGHLWAWITTHIFLLPVKVEGRENLKEGQSYVFVSNHQGAFDISLIYGYLNRNFKWMMKRSLSKVPVVGMACRYSHQIFVDRSSVSHVRDTYDEARGILRKGMSLVVFPEGARTFTGHMGFFRRGAFALADELQLPVCPLTINGSFDIMPRMRDGRWVIWRPLTLTIHKPLVPIGKGRENIEYLKNESYNVVMNGLEPKYQGFVENPDQ